MITVLLLLFYYLVHQRIDGTDYFIFSRCHETLLTLKVTIKGVNPCQWCYDSLSEVNELNYSTTEALVDVFCCFPNILSDFAEKIQNDRNNLKSKSYCFALILPSKLSIFYL